MKGVLGNLIKKLLKNNNIHLDWDEFNFQYQSHPSYPSLHSITGVLDHFKIENIAARVPVDIETINQLPDYSIIQFKDDEIAELVFLEKTSKELFITKENGRPLKITKKQLLESFTGIILAIENDENTVERRSSKNIFNFLLAGISALSLITLFYLLNLSILFSVNLFLSILGVIISISILKQEFGFKNLIGETFCSSDTDKRDCNAVLNSKGASIYGDLKLSDLCLVYFSGLSLNLVLLQFQNLGFGSIFLISLTAIPVTFFSIYYQGFVVKKWCALCLCIVGVLWLQALMPLILGSFKFDMNLLLIEGLTIVLSYSTILLSWNYLKPILKSKIENKVKKIEFFRFKRNYTVFSSLLKNSTFLNTNILNTNEITLGNPRSNLEVVVVTNPYCGHCKPLHFLVEDILDNYKDDIKVILRFNINIKDHNSEIVKLCSQLLKIQENNKPNIFEALSDAYNRMPFKEWAKKWNITDQENSGYFETLKTQKEWCIEHKINFTPHISINGYTYPKEYDRGDLKYFIEDLIEENLTSIKQNKALEKAI